MVSHTPHRPKGTGTGRPRARFDESMCGHGRTPTKASVLAHRPDGIRRGMPTNPCDSAEFGNLRPPSMGRGRTRSSRSRRDAAQAIAMACKVERVEGRVSPEAGRERPGIRRRPRHRPRPHEGVRHTSAPSPRALCGTCPRRWPPGVSRRGPQTPPPCSDTAAGRRWASASRI